MPIIAYILLAFNQINKSITQNQNKHYILGIVSKYINTVTTLDINFKTFLHYKFYYRITPDINFKKHVQYNLINHPDINFKKHIRYNLINHTDINFKKHIQYNLIKSS